MKKKKAADSDASADEKRKALLADNTDSDDDDEDMSDFESSKKGEWCQSCLKIYSSMPTNSFEWKIAQAKCVGTLKKMRIASEECYWYSETENMLET